MDEVSAFRRNLFVHPAHRTVGVLGCRSALDAYRPDEDASAADADTWRPEDDGTEPEEGVLGEDPA